MKQILITIALAVFAFLMMLFPAKGQNSKESLLWEISGNGLDKPSYLFGTIHLLCPEDLVLDDKITTALNNSEQLVLELDLSDRNVLREVQQKMMYQDGTTAKDYLSPEEYGIVKQFFSDSLQMPFEPCIPETPNKL
ncbi:MAG: TraB/GumN family protein [Bacteroidales bacterium]|nr:TraB/GumN family protein [Bacteroidales bacterium]